MDKKECLEALSRRELQDMAKKYGLRANQKSTALVSELLAILSSASSRPTARNDENMPTDVGNLGDACRATEDLREVAVEKADVDREWDHNPVTSRLSPIETRHSLPGKRSCETLAKEVATNVWIPGDEQDIDDSVTSLQDISLRNLTMNIDQFGRISISSPSGTSILEDKYEQDLPIPDSVRTPIATPSDTPRPSDARTRYRESEVRTPAMTYPSLVPKSNKAQRLRREALEKKKERLSELEKKNKPRASVGLNRHSTAVNNSIRQRPKDQVANIVKTAPTPVKVVRKSIAPPTTKKEGLNRPSIFVDDEISFKIGTATAAVSIVSAAMKPVKSNPKTIISKKVPNFKKMHSAQFSAQKSIVNKVSRDDSLNKKMDNEISKALSGQIVQNKENKANCEVAPERHAKTKTAVIKGRAPSDPPHVVRQKQFLQSAKSKREALQAQSRL